MAAEFGEKRVIREMLAELVGTTVTGMLLVAFVDDKLHWHEHQTIVESVRVLGDHVSASQLLQFLDSTAHMLEEIPRSHWPGLFERGRHLPDEAKVTILAMCTKVAFSDGHLAPEESDLIHQIAEWIDIDQSGRQLWKKGVHGALEAAQLRGFKYSGIENLDRPEEVQRP